MTKNQLNKIKTDFLKESGLKIYSAQGEEREYNQDDLDAVSVIVMSQHGMAGVVKIDNEPLKATKADIEELQNYLEDLESLKIINKVL